MPNYKVGQELYWCYFDEETGKCELDTHKVRTIRGGMVYVIEFVKGVTWVKRSRKHFDWGWADNIPRVRRSRCRQGDKFAILHTTKRQAYQDELMSVRKWLNKKGEWKLSEGERAIYLKGFKTLKGMVKRHSKKINKKS